MKKLIGYGLMGIGVLLIAPAWCAMGEGSIYNAISFVSLPAWLLAMVGLGLVGLGNFVQGPSRAERKARREAEAAAAEERAAKGRALRSRPEYKALVQRQKELSDAADRADEAGDIQWRDELREASYAASRELRAMKDEAFRPDRS